MDVDEYLKRINSLFFKENSVQNLYRLQQNHLLNVPFETIDIKLGNRIDTDLDRIYEKVVRKKRGGIFFELNYLFSWLLKQLGYDVYLISCSSSYMDSTTSNTTTTKKNVFTHMALIVNINDSKFLVDVGFHKNFRNPLKILLSTIQLDITGQYNIILDEEIEFINKTNFFILLKCISINIQNENEWVPIYKFDLRPKRIEELKHIFNLVYIQETFKYFNNNKLTCVIHTEYSVLSLVGNRLNEIIFAHSIEKSKNDSNLSKSEVKNAIENIYGIFLDDHDDIKPIDDEIP